MNLLWSIALLFTLAVVCVDSDNPSDNEQDCQEDEDNTSLVIAGDDDQTGLEVNQTNRSSITACNCRGNRGGCGAGTRCYYCAVCVNFCGGYGKRRKRFTDLLLSYENKDSAPVPSRAVRSPEEPSDSDKNIGTRCADCPPRVNLYCWDGECMNWGWGFECWDDLCPQCPWPYSFATGSCINGRCEWTHCSMDPPNYRVRTLKEDYAALPESSEESETPSSDEVPVASLEGNMIRPQMVATNASVTRFGQPCPGCFASRPYCLGRCVHDSGATGFHRCLFRGCSASQFPSRQALTAQFRPTCSRYADYCTYSNGFEYHCYFYFACHRDNIKAEGKRQFCKTYLNDLKDLEKDDMFHLHQKRLLTEETRKYCMKRGKSDNKKFVAALKKLTRKAKKQMDAAYAGDPDYKSIGQADNLYKRLNDADFLDTVEKMVMESEVFLHNEKENL